MTPKAGRASRPVKHITSADNEVFRTLRECLQTKGIRKHGLFMVFGKRAVRDTLKLHGILARNLILCNAEASTAPDTDLLSLVNALPAESFTVIDLSKSLFAELDVFGTHEPILVLRTPEIAVLDLVKTQPQGLEILCGLSDPANVGALLRSAAAFGASRVILLKESASPFHPRAVRAASATMLQTPVVRGPSIHELESTCGPIVALDMNGTDLAHFDWPAHLRLLMGEEGQGIPRELGSSKLIKIPMTEGVESLNATIAASIALYSYSAQRRLAPPHKQI